MLPNLGGSVAAIRIALCILGLAQSFKSNFLDRLMRYMYTSIFNVDMRRGEYVVVAKDLTARQIKGTKDSNRATYAGVTFR